MKGFIDLLFKGLVILIKSLDFSKKENKGNKKDMLKKGTEFIEEYLLNNKYIPFRDGAKVTCYFGLAEGYRKDSSNNYIWDSVRIHTGVDHSGIYTTSSNRLKKNVILAPFDFNRLEFFDYGKEHSLGSVLRLFNDKYKFEIRIYHINPKELSKDFLTSLKEGIGLKQGTFIAPSGNYGSVSDGRHSHTEVISQEESCVVLDNVLLNKYGKKVNDNYSTYDDIIPYYKTKAYWKKKPIDRIKEHYIENLEKRKIQGNIINSYRYKFKDWYSEGNKQLRTRYSYEKLFEGVV